MHNPVSRAWLESFAPAPEPTEIRRARRTSNGPQEFDLAQWLAASGLNIRREKPMDGAGTLWEIHCPWRPADGFTAWVSKAGDDVIRAGCRHDTCPAEGWRSLRKMIEPGWDDTAWVDREEPRQKTTDSGKVLPAEEESDAPAAETWVDSFHAVEFPLEVFPPKIREFVAAVSESMCVHQEMVATFMLPIFGGLLGNSRQIGYKDDWKEQARIWAAIVAVPGTKKTPTLKRVVAPVLAIQRELNRANSHAQEEWAALPDAERRRTPTPPWKHLSVTNATAEAFACAMRDHERGIVFWKDEITGWVTGMGQYKGGKGDDRQQWLELWSGGVPFGGLRKGDDKPYGSVANDPYASIIGGIQPDKAHVLVGKEDDGFPDRFLFCEPPSIPELADTESVSMTLRQGYERICRDLYALQSDGSLAGPKDVPMTPEGRQVFIENHQLLLDQKQSGDLPPALRGYWAKFEAYHLRLALVLVELWHVSEGTPEVLDEDMAVNAALLLDFYKKQAIKLFGNNGNVAPQEVDRPGPRLWKKALDWMDDGHQVTTLRDMMRHPWKRVMKKDALDALYTMEAQGHIKIKDGIRGSYEVSRKLHK